MEGRGSGRESLLRTALNDQCQRRPTVVARRGVLFAWGLGREGGGARGAGFKGQGRQWRDVIGRPVLGLFA